MRMFSVFLAQFVLIFALAGCGGGGGSSSSASAPIAPAVVTVAAVAADYTGSWRGTYTLLGTQKPIVITLSGNNGSGAVTGTVASEGVTGTISGTIAGDSTVLFTFTNLIDGTTWLIKLGKMADGGLGVVQINAQGASDSGTGSCAADSVTGKPLQGAFPVYYWLDQAGSYTRSGSMTLWYLTDTIYVGILTLQDGSSTAIYWNKTIGGSPDYWMVSAGGFPTSVEVNAVEALSQDLAVNGLLDSTLTSAANDGMVTAALSPYTIKMIGYTLNGSAYTRTPYIFNFFFEGTP